MMKRLLALALFVSGPALVEAPAQAQTSPVSGVLAEEFGDYSYNQGYVWRTGLFGSYRHPRRVLENTCAEFEGRLDQIMRLQRGAEASVAIGEIDYSFSPTDLWAWSTETFNAYSRDYDVSQTSYVVTFPRPDWAPVDAFGLFGCYAANSREPEWLVVVMVHHPRLLVIREVTAELVRRRMDRQEAQDLAEQERARQEEKRAIEEQQRAALARAIEDQRLAPWREALNVGDRTNCGMVIEVRGPIVRIQLPANYSLPSGEREFWIRRSELTDAAPITNCRFGG